MRRFVWIALVACTQSHREPAPVAVPPPPATTVANATEAPRDAGPPSAPPGVRWFPQTFVGPMLVDLDGDGVDELVGLHGGGGQPLVLMALDGKSLAPVWTSAAFVEPKAEHEPRILAAAAKGMIVVQDAAAQLHVIDVRTGRPLRTIANPAWGVQLFANPQLTKAHVSVAATLEGPPMLSVDLEQGTITPAKDRPLWAWAWKEGPDCDWHTDPSAPTCVTFHHPPARTPDFHPSITIRSLTGAKNFMVSVGAINRFEEIEHERDFLAAFDPKTKRSLWEKGIEADGDAVQEEDVLDLSTRLAHGRTADVLVANEKVYVAYEAPTKWRVVARDGRTGNQVFVTDLPLPMARFTSLTVTKDRVYVLLGGSLAILDATSGAVVATLAFAEPPTPPHPGRFVPDRHGKRRRPSPGPSPAPAPSGTGSP